MKNKKYSEKDFFNMGFNFCYDDIVIDWSPIDEFGDRDNYDIVFEAYFSEIEGCCAMEEINSINFFENKKNLAAMIKFILMNRNTQYYVVTLEDKRQANVIRLFKNVGFKQLDQFYNSSTKHHLTLLGFSTYKQKNKE